MQIFDFLFGVIVTLVIITLTLNITSIRHDTSNFIFLLEITSTLMLVQISTDVVLDLEGLDDKLWQLICIARLSITSVIINFRYMKYKITIRKGDIKQ